MENDPAPAVAVFPAGRYGLVQPRRPVTGALMVEHARALVADPDWRPGFTEVWDMRFTPTVDVTPADIPALLAVERETKEALAGSRTVGITARSLLLYSLQFYARLVRPLGREVVAVASAEEAAALLGVDAVPDLSAR